MTILVEPSAEGAKCVLCSTCYPEVESERLKEYNSLAGIPAALSIDVERITAAEFLAAKAKARRNGVDTPAFKTIRKELMDLPATRERLALEFLNMAWEALERGEDPHELIGWSSLGGSPERQNPLAYTELLEKVVFHYFELLAKAPAKPPVSRSSFGLGLAVVALRRADPGRFSALLCSLKRKCGEAEDDPRRRLVAEVEESILRLDRRMSGRHGRRSSGREQD